jgi:hypothetical protein
MEINPQVYFIHILVKKQSNIIAIENNDMPNLIKLCNNTNPNTIWTSELPGAVVVNFNSIGSLSIVQQINVVCPQVVLKSASGCYLCDEGSCFCYFCM